MRQNIIGSKAEDTETVCSEVIIQGIDALTWIIPNIRYLISVILDTAYKIQNELKSVVLKEVETKPSGLWNAFLHVDGRTNKLHTELDFCVHTHLCNGSICY